MGNQKPGFPSENVVPLIVDPDSGPLIPNLIKALEPEVLRSAMPEIIEALIRDRRRPGESNVVLILAGLIAARDAVAWNFLTPDERIRLAHVSTNYSAARKVLSGLGILPRNSGAAPFTPRPVLRHLELLVLFSSRVDDDDKIDWRRVKGSEILRELEPDQADVVELFVNLLRLNLWFEGLSDIYGADIAGLVKNNTVLQMEEARSLGLDKLLSRLDQLDETGQNQDSEFGPDMTIAVGFMDTVVPDGFSDEKTLQLVQYFSNLLNFERVRTQDEMRFFLRYFARYGTDRQMDEEQFRSATDRYARFGTRANTAEDQTLGEDWIGFDE